MRERKNAWICLVGKEGRILEDLGERATPFFIFYGKNLISIKVWKIPLNILHTQLLLCSTESSSSKKPLNHSGLKSTLKEVSFYMARSTLALFTEVSVMRILLQLMTFKRLDYVGEWPLGFPEKASGLPSSLSLSCSYTPHLEVRLIVPVLWVSPISKK